MQHLQRRSVIRVCVAAALTLGASSASAGGLSHATVTASALQSMAAHAGLQRRLSLAKIKAAPPPRQRQHRRRGPVYLMSKPDAIAARPWRPPSPRYASAGAAFGCGHPLSTFTCHTDRVAPYTHLERGPLWAPVLFHGLTGNERKDFRVST